MLPRMLYLIWTIQREQWLPPQRLEEIQQKRLREMVAHAYANTVFYRNRFKKCGITPEDIRTTGDLKKLELTKKSDLQEHFKDMVAGGYTEKNCRVNYTAGSTGNPAKILHDSYAMDYFTAESMLEFFDTGYKPWEKIAYTKRRTWKSHVLQNVGLLRSYHANTTWPEEQQVEVLRKVNASLIVSYPSILYSLAQVVAQKGYSLRPKGIVVGGEMLTPQVRTYIEDVFRSRVYETYATIEFSTLARECSHRNWHINSTQNVVEFEDGNIIVTGLINKAVPLIRYEIGDIGHPKEGRCPCGRGLPMMEMLEGRCGDTFILPDGREISPLRVWGMRLLLDSSLAAKRYQIIQESPELFIIRLVPTERFNEEISEKLKEELLKNVGVPVRVEVECVDEIPLIDDRKLKVEICKVKRQSTTS